MMKKDAVFVENINLKFVSSNQRRETMDTFHTMLEERQPVFISVDENDIDLVALKIVSIVHAFKEYTAEIVKISLPKLAIAVSSSNASVISSRSNETPVTQ